MGPEDREGRDSRDEHDGYGPAGDLRRRRRRHVSREAQAHRHRIWRSGHGREPGGPLDSSRQKGGPGTFVEHEDFRTEGRLGMDLGEYQRKAARTINPSLSEKERLIDAAAGLAEEAGEALAIVRKHLYQGKPLDLGLIVRSFSLNDGLIVRAAFRWYSPRSIPNRPSFRKSSCSTNVPGPPFCRDESSGPPGSRPWPLRQIRWR